MDNYCWLITLTILEPIDRPLAICTSPEEALKALKDFSNAYLRKFYKCGRESLLIFKIPMNNTSQERELWLYSSLEALVNEQARQVPETTSDSHRS